LLVVLVFALVVITVVRLLRILPREAVMRIRDE